jgi:hypothetical protein
MDVPTNLCYGDQCAHCHVPSGVAISSCHHPSAGSKLVVPGMFSRVMINGSIYPCRAS